ncbi:MAG: alanyl-tRNA editing protein [Candidatus Methanomethylophilaceae archaeon]|uniref:alanyl-tRNA editing protein n=1 Tax=Candidatus Methanarcanum hacksteinii TaxID=2911857 RepID=UPI002A76CFF2|nr:alanyl-tRNA editing protein [Candidatus Methanomethylophilaceae archaeon]
MTDELFKDDAYVSEFEAEITSVDGDYVTLGGTAFYPGGGGQVCDTGIIGGVKVVEVKEADGEIVHKVPGHRFSVGDRIWCSVDWDRRYDLMKGHTAEHLLFNSLHRQDPELNIVKIFISPESKYVIVDRDIGWDKISVAVRFANKVILENHSVRRSVMSKDDPDISKIRVKLDRIEEDEISVVEIEDVDLAACCGIHVMETEEIGAIFVSKKTSAGKDGVEIHFEIGEKAVDESMSLATSCLSIIDGLGSKPSDIERTISNMKHELESCKRMLKESTISMIRTLKPVNVGGVDVYAGIFHTSDRSVLTDAAERYKEDGAVAAFIGVGDNLTVLLASGDKRVDCKKLISETLSEFGGRGGGKPDFAQGGVADTAMKERILESLMKGIEHSL